MAGTIIGSVGRGGRNNPPDVKIVQQLLNGRLSAGIAKLAVDGLVGPKTTGAIVDFQKRNVPGMALAQSALIHPSDASWAKLILNLPIIPPLPLPLPPMPAPLPPVAGWNAKFTFEEFWNYTEPLEGGHAANCMFMVQDLQVATGMGITFTNKQNRNAGLAMALGLEWVNKASNARATPAEITADYDRVLSMEAEGRAGPGRLPLWMAATTCRITRAGLQQAVRNKVAGNINFVRTNRTDLGNFDSFPADAQLCVISLTWASGNSFRYPTFARHCKAGDFLAASKECGFASKENTLPRRQAAQELMMRNAARAAAGAADPNRLHWPTVL